jgi:hypothetical protein
MPRFSEEDLKEVHEGFQRVISIWGHAAFWSALGAIAVKAGGRLHGGPATVAASEQVVKELEELAKIYGKSIFFTKIAELGVTVGVKLFLPRDHEAHGNKD